MFCKYFGIVSGMTGIIFLSSVLFLPSALAVGVNRNYLNDVIEGKIGPQLQLYDSDAMLFNSSPLGTEVNKTDSDVLLEVKIGPQMQFYNSDGKLFLPSFLAVGFDSSEAEAFIKRKIGTHSLFHDSDGNTTSTSKNRKRRSMLRPSTCKFPTTYQDSYLNCNLYPNRISCTQICPFGYTYPEGIMRIMTCRNDENKWEPQPDFDEVCQAFVDCTIMLNTPGTYNCVTHALDHGPICEVSCFTHEDKRAVPKSKYQCDIHGNWKPKLPFCVKPISGQNLVAAPKGQLTP